VEERRRKEEKRKIAEIVSTHLQRLQEEKEGERRLVWLELAPEQGDLLSWLHNSWHRLALFKSNPSQGLKRV